MPAYSFHLVNVFAETTFGGNPLCVFDDARGMDEATMQSLALQFNLSETTFVLPSEQADVQVRIFTPGYEMRFAGHPTLGTSHVVRSARDLGDALTLEFKAGLVPVRAEGDRWTLVPPVDGAPRITPPTQSPAEIAALLGLNPEDLLEDPLWVDTGADQLLVPVKTADAVRRAQPDSSRLSQWPASSLGRKTAYVFAFTGDKDKGRDVVLSRYFFSKAGGGVAEDPGTGSACANLGGWLVARQHTLPASILVRQGEQAGRPCALYLDVDQNGTIHVGGQVIALGKGEIILP
jgi:PhzF family phenazine biosynthesis protein